RLRSEMPGMVLCSTARAGVPGEPDEEADERAAFLPEEGFDYCSVFAFSPEDGTRAAKLPDQVPDDVKLERTQRLIDIAEQEGFSATASHIGEVVDVIIDGIDDTDDGFELIGHCWFQAPDSDGVVHIEQGEATVGDIVKVELIDSFCYELVGRIVGA
ncbi:MAG: 30S ribosomal protein S12 methylthiotransferase RimO, partial [Atopobiaceae bacterium]|nr:30S ribosomal protein S12 methylthiotransferase RimO [Atopobiaceae bacterium]